MKTIRLKGLNRNILLRLAQADDLPFVCGLYQKYRRAGQVQFRKGMFVCFEKAIP